MCDGAAVLRFALASPARGARILTSLASFLHWFAASILSPLVAQDTIELALVGENACLIAFDLPLFLQHSHPACAGSTAACPGSAGSSSGWQQFNVRSYRRPPSTMSLR